MSGKDLITIQKDLKNEVMGFALDALTSSESFFSLMSGNPAAIPATIGHTIKAGINSKKIYALMTDLMNYKEKGHIQAKAIETEIAQDGVLEILDALDKENVDDERFKLMKKILFQRLRTLDQGNSLLEREYLQRSRTLSSTEIVVLFQAYDSNSQGQKDSFEEAFKSISGGLNLPWEMCKLHFMSLQTKGFVQIKDRDFYQQPSHTKIELDVTTFGRGFCNFVKEFERFEKHLSQS